jgi:hypothetical protein
MDAKKIVDLWKDNEKFEIIKARIFLKIVNEKEEKEEVMTIRKDILIIIPGNEELC